MLRVGAVLAVKGRAEPGGDFVVSAVLWPGLPEQPQRPLPQEDTYVALVSGLQLANNKADMMQVCGGGAATAAATGVGSVLRNCCSASQHNSESMHLRWTA
jgi:hypothetical protein